MQIRTRFIQVPFKINREINGSRWVGNRLKVPRTFFRQKRKKSFQKTLVYYEIKAGKKCRP
ncbi:hypothetical protein BES34_002925 [Leptospira inadai serovar Lyme]|uniref:Uncharacterized protein n=1 Tax=Leptospira inadai serovar Lyme TaxID=293084 RepID=A0ABX4YMP4_9LEPT|nr:hypothetical protein BES34_002925 [Leptospira inadai serovar Lyme]